MGSQLPDNISQSQLEYEEQAFASHLSNLNLRPRTGGKSSWFNRLRGIFNELVKDTSSKLTFDVASVEARRIKEGITSEYDSFIDSNSLRTRTWQGTFNELRKQLSQGTHGEMLVALEKMLLMMGFRTRRGTQKKGESDLVAMSVHTINKYQLSIELKTKQEGETETKASVSQTLTDAKVLAKKSPDYQTLPVLITQKEDFSEDATRAAEKEVTLFKTEEFDYLVSKLYSRLEKWRSFASNHQRHAFIDMIMSPHELLDIFTPQDDPIVTIQRIDSSIPNI